MHVKGYKTVEVVQFASSGVAKGRERSGNFALQHFPYLSKLSSPLAVCSCYEKSIYPPLLAAFV